MGHPADALSARFPDTPPVPSVERTAYPRFRPALARAEVEALYGPTGDELAFVRASARSGRGRLVLLVLLKGHQRLGRLPSANRVPAHVRRYLAAELGLPVDTPASARDRQARNRYAQLVRAFLGVRSYSEGGAGIAARAMHEAAATRSDPADLTDALAALVDEGWAVTPAQVARLSPYGTARVRRFGEYVLDLDGAPPPLVPRPLGLIEEPPPL